MLVRVAIPHGTLGTLSRDPVDLGLECDHVGWGFGAYELLGIDPSPCLESLGPLGHYLGLLRMARLAGGLEPGQLEELNMIRRWTRANCPDELLCLANRIYSLGEALGKLSRALRAREGLSRLDKVKLAIALTRYGLVNLGLLVLGEAASGEFPKSLLAMALIALLGPERWPRHVALDTRLLNEVNWVVATWGEEYLILINSLSRHLAVSSLNINLSGGRVVLRGSIEFTVGRGHVALLVAGEDNRGALFVGNLGNDLLWVNLGGLGGVDGVAKGRYLEFRLSNGKGGALAISPGDYLSVLFKGKLRDLGSIID